MYTLPKTIDVPAPAHRPLNLSNILFAVVGDVDRQFTAFALFKWRDRAEEYRKKYGGTIVHIETGNIG